MTVGRADAARPAVAAPRRAATAAICLCVALVFGLGASVNLAVGRLATSALQPSATEVLWIVDTYLVVFGCLLIPAGAIGDRFGRKGIMITGLAVLAAGSVASAVAPSVPLLLAARALTGAGAAFILPCSLPLMVANYPAEQRGHAVAVWTAMSGIGGVAGNVLGGLVLQFFDWQALFAVAAPIALLGLALIAATAPTVERHDHRIDLGGVAILVVGVFALLFGIIQGQELGWTSGPVLTGFAVALVVLTAFVLFELRQQHPLIDPRAFRYAGLRAGTLGIIVSFIAMYSVFYLNGQYLMNVKGYAAVLAGLGTAPLAVVLFLVSPRAVKLANRFGGRSVVTVGLLVVVTGLLLFSLCGPETVYPLYAACIVVVGLGSALSNPPLSTAIISSLPPHQQGVGSGINSFSREIGGALGFAIFGTILNGHFATGLPSRVRDMPGEAGDVARRAVGSALAVIRDSGVDVESLSQAVRLAFTDAMSVALRVVALILLLATVLVAIWYPKAERRDAPAK
ncbi:MFS transporter [Longimycelium tulufanense]|uniref:MFS transporter n=1 Tax=Longimycelium tulufanense TaxID=907463 RepID=A0A8J3CDK7_9PSEU|nr:MFS transporter [Longimycelium tulufanense]GGM52868.1 MFS transporter [Longimycelium tulufanense]